MGSPRVLAFVLAGGEGRRLRPLTENCAKPAVELGRGYRIVDFVLANLVNSGVSSIYLLAQYKPAPLIEHVARVWRPALRRRGCRLETLLSPAPYRGTADAVRRYLDLLLEEDPDIVAVFAADHVYRMDVRQMVRFHAEVGADITLAAAPVPIAEARRFGVVRTRGAGVVERFDEKPPRPEPMTGDPQHAFASMGNYLFDPIVLFDLLAETEGRGGNDFGRDVLPYALRSGARVHAYDFSTNRVPGLKPYEDPVYWRDVGTVEALDEARRDVEGLRPRLDLLNADWPLRPARPRSVRSCP
jgi:glucose-1-phosphate adenylyltransferase